MLSGSEKKRLLSLFPDKATRPGTPTRREESVSAARARPACVHYCPLSLWLPSSRRKPSATDSDDLLKLLNRTHLKGPPAREHPASGPWHLKGLPAPRGRGEGERNSCCGGRDDETGEVQVRLGSSRRRGWCGRRARGSSGWRRRRFAPTATGGGSLAHAPDIQIRSRS